MHVRSRVSWTVLPAALTLVLGASTVGATAPADAPAEGKDDKGAAYDLVIRRGHVIDPKNDIDGVRDVAVKDGKIAKVARHIDASGAEKTVDARGQYVTPGLVDMHAHMFPGPKQDYANGWNGVAPDGFTLRSGVTTAVDTGSSGASNFAQFKEEVIDKSKTRVLAFLNIVGKGMAGHPYEQDLEDMKADVAAKVAKEYPETIVGIKTAHYNGPEWDPVERSVEAGEEAGIPAMIDFGADSEARPLSQLLTEKLRPGDIYSHMYSGLRGELGEDGKLNPAMQKGRDRGIVFEVGHGGGSFSWDVAVPGMKEGFTPDVISTDLHISSMNSGMKDLSNVMSKFLTLGMPLEDVVEASTWKPAQTIQHPELGHLSVGAPADIAVFTLERGDFGFVDSFGWRIDGNKKLVAETTVRAGEVVWDLNGQAAPEWYPGANPPENAAGDHEH
ncbi:amidohydrolase/deacetylase family metallohydrolase [Streptomyces sp. WMMC500]|uniref:amidohydrolase/deacetylase family metallohydrolase n=1 Tax=Streptomyces sp. WMMC500 TaxID=3015154 RepID=UPI00248C70DA|nr:amidohydrolase/deacetylase family metallohydrolase [Streptomyces sp. WMMC500]WBB61164.1 amidohydrolase/deacetylase family metallohydrolase [Streptomyces sp. WMMC500]